MTKQNEPPKQTQTEAQRLERERAELAQREAHLSILARAEALGGQAGLVKAVLVKLRDIAEFNANPFGHPGGAATHWKEIQELIELGLAINEAGQG